MFFIGPHLIRNKLVLAPMAGITDRPFRTLCKRLGAGLTVSEMISSDTRLWHSKKSSLRLDHSGECGPISVQIVGSEAPMLAAAAKANVARGAEIIDINMGCPAKKVCNKAAGSALLRDERLVAEILNQVTAAVSVPVTLKIRTGWSREQKNAIRIARIAEQAGIALLAVHGRTRADKFTGQAEYETIAAVKNAVNIPVIANGDITNPQQAKQVLADTGADGLMIGRAAQGRPWLFSEINDYLSTGKLSQRPSFVEFRTILLQHLSAIYEFYGESLGVRIARKHLGWYLSAQGVAKASYSHLNLLETAKEQRLAATSLIDRLVQPKETAA